MLPIIAPKTNNYLGIQLTKDAQDWDAVNHTNLQKEIEVNLHKWRDIPLSMNWKTQNNKGINSPQVELQY